MEVIDVVVVCEVEELLQIEVELVEIFGIHEQGCVQPLLDRVNNKVRPFWEIATPVQNPGELPGLQQRKGAEFLPSILGLPASRRRVLFMNALNMLKSFRIFFPIWLVALGIMKVCASA